MYFIMRHKVPLDVKKQALELLQSGQSVQSVSKQLGFSPGELRTWSLIYEKEGEKGLAAYPKNICTIDIKDRIICRYREKRVPLHMLSAKYSVPYSSVSRCVSTYKRKGWSGVEGTIIDMMEVIRSGDTMEESLSKAELKHRLKEALNELDYLRAEIALLKKVKALVEAEERRNKHSHKSSNH